MGGLSLRRGALCADPAAKTTETVHRTSAESTTETLASNKQHHTTVQRRIILGAALAGLQWLVDVCVCLFIQSSPPPQPTPPRTPNSPSAAPTRLARARRGRGGCPSRLAIQNEEEDRTRDGPSLFPLPAPRCAPQPSMDCSLERPVGVQCSRTPTGFTGVLRSHAPRGRVFM